MQKIFGAVVIVSIICVILVMSLFGAIANTSNLNSQIQAKDSQITELNSQIANFNQQINDINSQQNTMSRMQKVIDATGSLFFGRAKPIDTYSGDWAGNWVPVTTLQGSTNPTNTQTFQISSAYHLFRLNITLTGSTQGNLQFGVAQKVGTQEITNMIYSITIDNAPTEKDTVYLFAETISTNTYYLSIQNYEGITSWNIQVEQLSQ